MLGFSVLILGLSASAWGDLANPRAWEQSQLQQRQQNWPGWTLPGPVSRPGADNDLFYPLWFEGIWAVESRNPDHPDDAPLRHQARFQRNSAGRIVADRAFNAEAIGRAQLGEQLLRVEDDPSSANRQLTLLRGDRSLESTVVGRGQQTINDREFLANELVVQIMRGPGGAPRISRIETLSSFRGCVQKNGENLDPAAVQKLRSDGLWAAAIDPEQINAEQIYVEQIYIEQWQARYPGPGESLSASPLSTSHYQLTLTPLQDPLQKG